MSIDANIFRGCLTLAESKSYVDSVLCLQSLPSLLDPVEVPGAKNRYDGKLNPDYIEMILTIGTDFLAVHINQTQIIHMVHKILLLF
jgi:hypothetical protein